MSSQKSYEVQVTLKYNTFTSKDGSLLSGQKMSLVSQVHFPPAISIVKFHLNVMRLSDNLTLCSNAASETREKAGFPGPELHSVLRHHVVSWHVVKFRHVRRCSYIPVILKCFTEEDSRDSYTMHSPLCLPFISLVIIISF